MYLNILLLAKSEESIINIYTIIYLYLYLYIYIFL